jgi:alcohol dehydrogenase
MRQLFFVQPGHLEWREEPEPRIEAPTDALVRPVAVTTCDGDIVVLTGRLPLPGPFSIGHEFVAEVVACGEQVTTFRLGQLVVVPVQISCGACDRCRRGLTAFCRAVQQPAAFGLGPFSGNWPGVFADLARIPFAHHMMMPVPDGVDPRTLASAGDNIADAWRTVAPPLADMPGAKVLVVGWGSIGLFAVAIAHALGAERVDYLDHDPHRLSVAEALGGRAIEGHFSTRPGSYPITVDASFDPAGLVCALRALTPGGRCTSVGVYPGETPLPLLEMWQRAVHFHIGVANCRAHMPHVLELARTGHIRPGLVTTEVLDWEAAPTALAEPSMKPLFVRAPLTPA